MYRVIIASVLATSMLLAACSESSAPAPVLTASDTEGRFAGHKQPDHPDWVALPRPPEAQTVEQTRRADEMPDPLPCHTWVTLFSSPAPLDEVMAGYVEAGFETVEGPLDVNLNGHKHRRWAGRLETSERTQVAAVSDPPENPEADQEITQVLLLSADCPGALSPG